jgi:hypothetical protein
MRPHILPKLFNKFFYRFEIVGVITSFFREFSRMSNQAWQIPSYTLVMDANNMLNQKCAG